MKKFMKIAAVIFVVSICVCVCVVKNIHFVYYADRPYTHTQVLTEPIDGREDVGHETIEDFIADAKIIANCDLTFSEKNDIKNGKANCVGFAKYGADVFNDIAIQKGFSERAKPVVGYVYLGRFNLHKVFHFFISDKKWRAFTKDHDYVRVIDKNGNVVASFDPTFEFCDFKE